MVGQTVMAGRTCYSDALLLSLRDGVVGLMGSVSVGIAAGDILQMQEEGAMQWEHCRSFGNMLIICR